MSEELAHLHQRWYRHFDGIDLEIAQLAMVCQVQLLDPGVIDHVLHNDMGVCGHSNARTFAKMRTLLMMHYSVREKAVLAPGQDETLELVGEIVSRLRDHVGDRLGGPPRGHRAQDPAA